MGVCVSGVAASVVGLMGVGGGGGVYLGSGGNLTGCLVEGDGVEDVLKGVAGGLGLLGVVVRVGLLGRGMMDLEVVLLCAGGIVGLMGLDLGDDELLLGVVDRYRLGGFGGGDVGTCGGACGGGDGVGVGGLGLGDEGDCVRGGGDGDGVV